MIKVVLILLIIFFVLIGFILFIIAEWKLFKKAGKCGWISLILFYNSWVLTKIAALNWWWFLFLIIDFTFKFSFDNISLSFDIFSFIGHFNCFYNLAKKFGYNRSTAIAAGIFPYIFVFVFAFSKDCIYDINYPVSNNGIFGDNSFVNNNYASTGNDDKDINDENKHLFCENCGIKLKNNINYCPSCGDKINK